MKPFSLVMFLKVIERYHCRVPEDDPNYSTLYVISNDPLQ